MAVARRTREEAEETRSAILEAALDLFSERGYCATSFGDIADRIGMTRGAVYWHFREKAELLAALVNEMLRETVNKVQAEVPEVNTFEDLKAHFLARTRIIVEDERVGKFIYFIALQMEWSVETLALTRKRLHEVQTLPFADVERFLAHAARSGYLREEYSVNSLLQVLSGMWKGIVQQHFMGVLEGDVCACVELGLDLFVQGVRSEAQVPRGDGNA